MKTTAAVNLDHLVRLSDRHGVFEHAEGSVRRVEHGYCTDDNARVLVVLAREADEGVARQLTRTSLRFVLDAQAQDGRCCNRRDRHGTWTDRASNEDCWGRVVWALGAMATDHPDSLVRRLARNGYGKSVVLRSPWPRAMAFAALGAAALATVAPAHGPTTALLADALAVIGEVPAGPWRWPEPRLAYANAALAEAVLAAGVALDRPEAIDRGLVMLGWLLEREMVLGHLSVTPAGGAGPVDSAPGFDQQPIEVAALADACWRAYRVTGDAHWLGGVSAAEAWFNGDNDCGLRMFDTATGGGYDGLHADAVNRNQGAESTLALLATMQRARAAVQAS